MYFQIFVLSTLFQSDRVHGRVIKILVGCTWVLRPSETESESISGRLPERGSKRRDERRQ